MRLFAVLFVAGALLTACGDEKKAAVEALPLDTYKKEISYLMGASHAEQVVKDPNWERYDKAAMVEGFKLGLDNTKAFGQADQQNIMKLLGQTQGEFHDEFKVEGSKSIGKFLGSSFADSWQRINFMSEFDKKYLVYGFHLGVLKQDTLIKAEIKQKMLQSFMTRVNTRIASEVDRKEKVFFDKVKVIPGIKDIGNGIYLETLTAGNGGSPLVSDDVKAHYVLMSAAGDTIQSSLNGPEVPVFNLGQVIQGWTIGIPQMKKGGKYKLYVPQGMAYGANPPSPDIEPFATLVFYVELIDFGKAGSLK